MNSSPVMWMTWVILVISWPAQSQSVSSRSGQFVVNGPTVLGTALRTVNTSDNRVSLDPALLAVSCERIKARLLELLEAPDRWQAKILVTIDPSLTDSHAIMLKANRYSNGWQYKLRFPAEVNRRHLVKTMVEILLMEMGNRHATRRPVELPPWLAEGLTEILSGDNFNSLTLSPQVTVARRVSAKEPMATIKEVLTRRPPLSLDELNWPQENDLAEYQALVYEKCAQLMVLELLRLDDGPLNMVRMLNTLPEHSNWQFAFLKSFQAYFPRMIEWDKWWSLLLVNVANRDLYMAWSAEESWSKFEEILTTPVQVRVRQGELPMTAQANLQSIVQEWDSRPQIELLRLKLNHLNALRIRASPEIIGLVDDYRAVLGDYIKERSKPGMARRLLPGLRDPLLEETVARLDELEQRKGTVRRLLDMAKSDTLSQTR